MPRGSTAERNRLAGVGAMWSESESKRVSWNCGRRVERGERCLFGEIGDDGGEKPWREVRAAGFFLELVGVVSRAARAKRERVGDDC